MDEIVFEFRGTTSEKDEHARDLVAWLNEDEDLHGVARVRMVGPGIGEQGGAADAALVLAAAAPLAGPFFGWLTERVKSRRVIVKISRSGHAGNPLEVEVTGPDNVNRLFSQVAEFFDRQGQG